MTDEQLLSSFRREGEDSWICIKPILFDGTARNVAIMPGTVVTKADFPSHMDIAREIEEAEARRGKPPPMKTPLHH